MQPIMHSIHDSRTALWQCMVTGSKTLPAIVDPVLHFEPAISTVSTAFADLLLSLSSKGYTISYLPETRAHADHLSASNTSNKPCKPETPSPRLHRQPDSDGAGQVRTKVRYTSKELDTVFDRLLEANEQFQIINVPKYSICRATHRTILAKSSRASMWSPVTPSSTSTSGGRDATSPAGMRGLCISRCKNY